MTYGVLNGVSQGTRQLVYRTVWAQFYGRAHLGAIQSIQNSIGVLATGCGPLSMAVLRGWAGSYPPVLLGTAAVGVGLAALALALLRPPAAPRARG